MGEDMTDINCTATNWLLSAGLGLCLTTSAAVASGQEGCPTSIDLDKGVRAVFANGQSTDYKRLDNDLLEIFEPSVPNGADGVIYTSQLGLYDLEAAELHDGKRDTATRLILNYAEAAESLPVPVSAKNLPIPVPGEIWLGAVTTSWPSGQLETDTAIYVFGTGISRKIDGCDYDVVPVKASFLAGESWVMHDYMFIPSLLIAILTARQFSGMEHPEGRAVARLERIAP